MILHELAPDAAAVAVLANPRNPINNKIALDDIQAAASILGLRVRVLNASTASDIDEVFGSFVRERPKALIVINNSFFTSRRTQIVLLAARYGVPAVYSAPEYAEAGGLMSYSADFGEIYHQIGLYAARILRGAKPADLPVVQPTKFEFVINLKAAKAIGITIPTTLLARADQVIE